MMSTSPDNLQKSLQNFGLSIDESKVYIHLIKFDLLTPLKISRDLKIARTKVYRLLESLSNKGFVSQRLDGYGAKYSAESFEKLKLIVTQKEAELSSLKTTLNPLLNQLEQISAKAQSSSRIVHYKGIEGLKQVTWNSTKAKSLLRIYEIEDMDAFLDHDFSEKARIEFVKQGVNVKQLTNHKKLDEMTQITEHIKMWDVKYIDPKIFEIKFEVLVYNNVYCMYSFLDEQIFCVEIYNESLANMQKQIFDFMWQKAKPMKKLNQNGRVELA